MELEVVYISFVDVGVELKMQTHIEIFIKRIISIELGWTVILSFFFFSSVVTALLDFLIDEFMTNDGYSIHFTYVLKSLL